MALRTKIAVLAFSGGIVVFVELGPVQGQWIGGPVLIGGDDTDDHFQDPVFSDPRGRPYNREGFSFLGPRVTNGNTMAVCLGCDAEAAQDSFELAFDDSVLPGMAWIRVILTDLNLIQDFFDGTGAVNIQDAGIIYLPSGVTHFNDGSGMTQVQLDVVNSNRAVLTKFVLHREDGGGGLFTHTLEGLTNPYLWLNALVSEIKPVFHAEDFQNDELNLTCAATEAFFPGLIVPGEVDEIRNAIPYHTVFEMMPGARSFGGLTVLVRGQDPLAEVIILGAPLPPGFTDCDHDGITGRTRLALQWQRDSL